MDSKRYQCINPPPFPYTLARMVFKKRLAYTLTMLRKSIINLSLTIFFSISEIKDKSFTKRDFFLSFCGVCVWLVGGGYFPYLIFFIFTLYLQLDVTSFSSSRWIKIHSITIFLSIYLGWRVRSTYIKILENADFQKQNQIN